MLDLKWLKMSLKLRWITLQIKKEEVPLRQHADIIDSWQTCHNCARHKTILLSLSIQQFRNSLLPAEWHDLLTCQQRTPHYFEVRNLPSGRHYHHLECPYLTWTARYLCSSKAPPGGHFSNRAHVRVWHHFGERAHRYFMAHKFGGAT